MTVDRMTPPDRPEYYPKRIWESAEEDETKPCHEQAKVSLPSIHQAFPDLERLVALPEPRPELQRDRLPRTPPSATTPTGPHVQVPITPPEYIVSPNWSKRRRVSSDEEMGFNRASEVPRHYTVARRAVSRPQSPSLETRLPFRPLLDSAPSSPYYTDHSMSLPVRSPDSINLYERAETRPAPPSLPISNYELGVGENYRMQGHTGDEYRLESSRRSSFTPSNGYHAEAGGHGYRPPSYPYYHHPNRVQSLSVGSSRLDRTPFSSGGYGHHYQETYVHAGDFGMGTNGDGKQRKRRGNLPKETTEKLRNWFLAHLSHPYPTEDEKQALMRDTNLQMNQISNWFINARRRQLPHMINNARAEKDVMKGRSGDVKSLPSSEHKDHDHGCTEGGVYGDIEPERRRTNGLKRGSI